MNKTSSPKILPKPSWIRVKTPSGLDFNRTRDLVRQSGLPTICESALCPNRAECWRNGTATFLLLGDVCTRHCSFCAVKGGRPAAPDDLEPQRVAEAVEKMGLKHAVLTSVARDDLPDGGASYFYATVNAVKKRNPSCTVEILVPDFQGNWEALDHLMKADIAILNHNLETVPRLYSRLRSQAVYERSLELLRRARRPGVKTKSGIMLGVGEEKEEVMSLMEDLRKTGCSILTIGQYLQPNRRLHPVVRYVSMEEFADYKEWGKRMGYEHVESTPFARSSYHAWKQV
ncbi:MAG: lipoyl synthase [Candidatus Omnitrophota bacterium]